MPNRLDSDRSSHFESRILEMEKMALARARCLHINKISAQVGLGSTSNYDSRHIVISQYFRNG